MGITLCMIVKNEADRIEGALDSVRFSVDEILTVDTGCTDSTIPRTLRFSPQVIIVQWVDSFAEARNRTLTEARQPWIPVFDADARIAARDLPKLTDAANKGCGDQAVNRTNFPVLERVNEDLSTGAYNAAKAVLSRLEQNPFFPNEVQRFKTVVHGGTHAHGCDRQREQVSSST